MCLIRYVALSVRFDVAEEAGRHLSQHLRPLRVMKVIERGVHEASPIQGLELILRLPLVARSILLGRAA